MSRDFDTVKIAMGSFVQWCKDKLKDCDGCDDISIEEKLPEKRKQSNVSTG